MRSVTGWSPQFLRMAASHGVGTPTQRDGEPDCLVLAAAVWLARAKPGEE
jgi:hypothetical protein